MNAPTSIDHIGSNKDSQPGGGEKFQSIQSNLSLQSKISNQRMQKMRNIKSEISNLMNQIDQRQMHKRLFENDLNQQQEDANTITPLSTIEQDKTTVAELNQQKIESQTFNPSVIKKSQRHSEKGTGRDNARAQESSETSAYLSGPSAQAQPDQRQSENDTSSNILNQINKKINQIENPAVVDADQKEFTERNITNTTDYQRDLSTISQKNVPNPAYMVNMCNENLSLNQNFVPAIPQQMAQTVDYPHMNQKPMMPLRDMVPKSKYDEIELLAKNLSEQNKKLQQIAISQVEELKKKDEQIFQMNEYMLEVKKTNQAKLKEQQ